MTRWMTKKDRNGRNRHIPIRDGMNTGYSAPAEATLNVRPEIENGKETGDMEYIGYCRSPAMGLEAARRHVLNNELKGIPLDEIKEEYFYYDSQGHGISDADFYKHGGAFDYIAEGPDGRKYMVNASIEKRGPGWNISGIANWLREPKKEEHLYREGSEKKERKKFEEAYGKKRGDYVYGATVGKVKRERESKARKMTGGE